MNNLPTVVQLFNDKSGARAGNSLGGHSLNYLMLVLTGTFETPYSILFSLVPLKSTEGH